MFMVFLLNGEIRRMPMKTSRWPSLLRLFREDERKNNGKGVKKDPLGRELKMVLHLFLLTISTNLITDIFSLSSCTIRNKTLNMTLFFSGSREDRVLPSENAMAEIDASLTTQSKHACTTHCWEAPLNNLETTISKKGKGSFKAQGRLSVIFKFKRLHPL